MTYVPIKRNVQIFSINFYLILVCPLPCPGLQNNCSVDEKKEKVHPRFGYSITPVFLVLESWLTEYKALYFICSWQCPVGCQHQAFRIQVLRCNRTSYMQCQDQDQPARVSSGSINSFRTLEKKNLEQKKLENN